MKEIKVLDKGFVRLVDHMGDDAAIVQMARTSYGKGTKTINEDKGLIRYLMRHKHTSPFESCEFKFHMKLPIFVARQMIRHRTASVNEISARYSELPAEYYIPGKDRIVAQSTSNKQCSSANRLGDMGKFITSFDAEAGKAHLLYSDRLSLGLTREIARVNLPLSTYTEWYWKMDLHNLLHFLKLRLHPHAQWEIRVYAEAIYELIKPIVPDTCEAFEDYILNATHLTSIDTEALSVLLTEILNGQVTEDNKFKTTLNKIATAHFNNSREKTEFISKINKLFKSSKKNK